MTTNLVRLTLLLSVVVATHGATADTITNQTAAPPSAAKPMSPTEEKRQAIEALNHMGRFLRTQDSFSVRSEAVTEHVLASGQKVDVLSTGTLRVERPNHLRADIVSDRKNRQYFYDGKTFTLNSPKVGYYATVAAPSTINQLIEKVGDEYGLEMPLADLFYWGTDKDSLDDITSARIIGAAKIDGIDTTQYAFRQKGLDWQIWIEDGDRPLPRRLALTTLDDPAKPEATMQLSWMLNVQHDPRLFSYMPASDSQQIAFEMVHPLRSAQR
jgi:hypothetical protein